VREWERNHARYNSRGAEEQVTTATPICHAYSGYIYDEVAKDGTDDILVVVQYS